MCTDLWPMKMDYYVCIYNIIPVMQYGISAIDMWSRSRFDTVSEPLSNCHVWDCPTYVLEPKLQNPVLKIHKWDNKIQIGATMGFSMIHSKQVGLVLNLLTGSISPQYHVLFYDMFSNMASITSVDP